MRFKLLAAPIPAHGGIIACFTRNHSRISRKSLVCRETGNLASAPKLAVTRTSAVRRPQTSENRMTHTTHARGSGPLVPRPYIRTWAPIRAANRFSYTPGHRGTTNQLMPHAGTCTSHVRQTGFHGTASQLMPHARALRHNNNQLVAACRSPSLGNKRILYDELSPHGFS